MEEITVGTLYIVATPIGNSRDMSPRGTQILTDADIIAAEDTRRSMVLLNKLGIKNKLVSNHKFNEYGKAKYFIQEMKAGKSVAVITDAGTPCISDPGNELIKAAVEEGIRVVGIPGCCAAVNALAISGFDLSSFTFFGFFPRENAERRKLLERIEDKLQEDEGLEVKDFKTVSGALKEIHEICGGKDKNAGENGTLTVRFVGETEEMSR